MNTAASRIASSAEALHDADQVLIGKDVLELVTGAMYVDPLTIFREYIQNSADATDLACDLKLYRPGEAPRIDILLDATQRTITIRDNGTGIARADFWKRMTSIGASAKKGTRLRGFRGVGRLSGLGYASEVIFRTQAKGEAAISQITWNGRRLRELLRDRAFEGGLGAIIREVARTEVQTSKSTGDHFFEVQLRGVSRIGNDLLLNPDTVRSFVSQAAPVPFSPSFNLGGDLHEFLQRHGVSTGLQIYIDGGDEPVFRSITNRIRTHGKTSDALKHAEYFEIPSLNGDKPDAVGWILHHSYLGAVPRTAGYAGLRMRAGNIQVGSPSLLDPLFAEPRFNSWCIGEIHVLSERIIPNGRRDDFEVNAHYQNLIGHVTAIALQISKTCRDRSIQRNRAKRATLLRNIADEQLMVLRDPKAPKIIKEYYRDLVSKTLQQLERIATDKKYPPEDQRGIQKLAESLKCSMENIDTARGPDPAVSFLPKNQQKLFLETVKLVIQSCDTPQQAAVLTRRVFEKARRKHRNR